MSDRRLPVVVVLAAALVGLIAVAGDDEVAAPADFGRARVVAMPVADDDDALTSIWYCAAGTAAADGQANLSVVIANPGDAARAGTVTWVPTPGRPVVQRFTLAPRDQARFDARPAVDAPVVSAVVETTGGGVVVEHEVVGPTGRAAAPCASDPSDRWYLAGGTTDRDARQTLALFNPFPDDAIVDVTFQTNNGRRRPTDLRGLPVAAGSTVHVDVGSERAANRHSVTAASVEARTGRLVVDRVQRFDGSAGRTGMALTGAASATARTWWFPEGLWSATATERWHLYNPGDREAVVSLEVLPDKGDGPEPRDITLAPGAQVVVDAADASGGVPSGVAHSATIRSLNDVPFVAEREIDSRAAGRRGWSSIPGATESARRWVLAVGEASETVDEWVVVLNPGSRAVRVSIVGLASFRRLEIEGLRGLRIPPAGRVAAQLGDRLRRSPLPIVVEADGPVVVERGLYAVGGSGVSLTMGVPLR